MRVKIPKYLSLIPLENLPENVVGYLCTWQCVETLIQ
jgi:hypothetical protein